VQSESVACVDDVPSLTVILQVGELKPVRRIEKLPVDDAFPMATPSIVIVAAGRAPCPSTRSSPAFSCARVSEIAAAAAWAATRTTTLPSSNARTVRRIGLESSYDTNCETVFANFGRRVAAVLLVPCAVLLDGELFYERLRCKCCLLRCGLPLLVLPLLLARPLLPYGLLALELCHRRLSL